MMTLKMLLSEACTRALEISEEQVQDIESSGSPNA